MTQSDIDQELMHAAEAGSADRVSELLACGASPRKKRSYALRCAAAHGHVDCLRLLLPVSNPKAEDFDALRVAAEHGHAECVRLLLPVSDPKAMNSFALQSAAMNGHAQCVRILLPVSDPRAENSDALRWAAWRGHEECVRLLLPVSRANALDAQALRMAAEHGHAGCVRLLLAESGPLGEVDGLFEAVIESGQATMAALLVEAEPRLLDKINLSQRLAAALENGHGNLASYLSSIIDEREILGVAQDAQACTGSRHARL